MINLCAIVCQQGRTVGLHTPFASIGYVTSWQKLFAVTLFLLPLSSSTTLYYPLSSSSPARVPLPPASTSRALWGGYNYNSTSIRVDARATVHQKSFRLVHCDRDVSNPLAAVTLTYSFRPQRSNPPTLVGVRSWRRSSNLRIAWSNRSRIVVVTTALSSTVNPIRAQIPDDFWCIWQASTLLVEAVPTRTDIPVPIWLVVRL